MNTTDRKQQQRETRLQQTAASSDPNSNSLTVPTSKKIHNYVYNFKDLLGEGGFSKVYKATNETNSKSEDMVDLQVAIKIVELSSINSAKLEELLRSEIKILESIKHPNVVQCVEVLSSQRNCYIITQLCEGGDLGTALKQKGSYSEREIYKLAWQIFQGLKYLSQMKIVHRDLKVCNIFLREGVAKIADFGFAKVANSTFLDASIGSPIYMSPQGLIYNTYGPKTDIWAFGIILYELVYGQTPSCKCRNQIQLKRSVNRQITLSDLKPELSEQFKEFLVRCLDVAEKTRITIPEMDQHPWIVKIRKQLGIAQPKEQVKSYADESTQEQERDQLSKTQTWDSIYKRNSTTSKFSVQPQTATQILSSTSSGFYKAAQKVSKTNKDIKIYRPSENLMKLMQKNSKDISGFIDTEKLYQTHKDFTLTKQVSGGQRYTPMIVNHVDYIEKQKDTSFSERFDLERVKTNNEVTHNLPLQIEDFEKSKSISIKECLKGSEQTKDKGRQSYALYNTSEGFYQKNSSHKNRNTFDSSEENKQTIEAEKNRASEDSSSFEKNQYKTESHFFKTKNLSQLFPTSKQMSLAGKLGKGQRQFQEKVLPHEKQIKKYAMEKQGYDNQKHDESCESYDFSTKRSGVLNNKFNAQNQSLEREETVKTAPINESKSCLSCISLLPGGVYFSECIGILHYCRLLFKYITLLKDLQSGNIDPSFSMNVNTSYMKIYSQFLINVLLELEQKIKLKQVIYSRMKSTKEVKIKSVVQDYLNKYTKELSVKREVIAQTKSEEKSLLIKLLRESLESDAEELYQQLMLSFNPKREKQIRFESNSNQKRLYQTLLLLSFYSVLLIFNTQKLKDCQEYTKNSKINNSALCTQADHSIFFHHFQKTSRIEEIIDTKVEDLSVEKYLSMRKELFGKDELKNNRIPEKQNKQSSFLSLQPKGDNLMQNKSVILSSLPINHKEDSCASKTQSNISLGWRQSIKKENLYAYEFIRTEGKINQSENSFGKYINKEKNGKNQSTHSQKRETLMDNISGVCMLR